MEITHAMVAGYINAVANALADAEHQLTAPDVSEHGARIVIPDALTTVARCGLALAWNGEDGWEATYYDAEPSMSPMPTDLGLGVVPQPEVVVKAVRAIVADENLRAGRILPGTAELLALYEDGTAPVSEEARLRAERNEMAGRIRGAAHELDDELRDTLGWDWAHQVRDRLLSIADGVG